MSYEHIDFWREGCSCVTWFTIFSLSLLKHIFCCRLFNNRLLIDACKKWDWNKQQLRSATADSFWHAHIPPCVYQADYRRTSMIILISPHVIPFITVAKQSKKKKGQIRSASLFEEIQYDPLSQITASHAHLSTLYWSAKRINVTYVLLMLFIPWLGLKIWRESFNKC